MTSTPTDNFDFVRLIFSLLFVLTLGAGTYLLRNSEKLFGVDPDMPGENSSSRAYTKMLVFALWAHIAVLTGSFAFLFH